MGKGRRGGRCTRALMLAIFMGALAGPGSAAANTITVSTDSDSIANDGVCSLREAIRAGNLDTTSGAMLGECAAGSGADTVVLPAGFYTITRTGADDGSFQGDFDVT